MGCHKETQPRLLAVRDMAFLATGYSSLRKKGTVMANVTRPPLEDPLHERELFANIV
jgi:hypothetical protein